MSKSLRILESLYNDGLYEAGPAPAPAKPGKTAKPGKQAPPSEKPRWKEPWRKPSRNPGVDPAPGKACAKTGCCESRRSPRAYDLVMRYC